MSAQEFSTVTLQLRIHFDPQQLNPGVVFADELRLDLSGVRGVKQVELLSRWIPPTADQLGAFNGYELRELGWPSSLESPTTVSPGDAPTERVKVVPYDLAIKLAKLDPERQLFHIRLFPTPRGREPFGEVWTIRSWNEVHQTRMRWESRRTKTEADRDFNGRREDLLAKLRYYIVKATQAPAETAAKGAQQLLQGGQGWDIFVPFLQLPTDILNELHAIQTTLKHERDSDPSAESCDPASDLPPQQDPQQPAVDPDVAGS